MSRETYVPHCSASNTARCVAGHMSTNMCAVHTAQHVCSITALRAACPITEYVTPNGGSTCFVTATFCSFSAFSAVAKQVY